jgi:hypothetical protein
MSYALDLTVLAQRQRAKQPDVLRAFIDFALDRLAESPTLLGKRRPGSVLGQEADFRFEHEGASLWVTIVFLYGQDEETPHIERIAVEYG